MCAHLCVYMYVCFLVPKSYNYCLYECNCTIKHSNVSLFACVYKIKRVEV